MCNSFYGIVEKVINAVLYADDHLTFKATYFVTKAVELLFIKLALLL
jgi:hypothetical protein